MRRLCRVDVINTGVLGMCAAGLEILKRYYRIESYEVARTYLETAVKSPTLPADVRGKAQQYLAEIEFKTSPSSLGGEVFLGWRYQSNANLGSAGSQVLLFGQPANLNHGGLGRRLGRRESASSAASL